jgi:hypothetical protein
VETIEEVADTAPGGFDCAGVGFAQQGLQLGKDLFDRIEVGRVAGQEEQLGAGGADQAAHGLALVAAEIIHDDNIARAQGGDQELLDIGAKAGAVDWPVDDAGRGDAVVAQRRQKGQRAPAALRHLGDQASAATAAAMPAGHVGLGPGLVDEHQALGVKPALMRLPPGPAAGDVGAILLAGVQRFF